MTTVSVILPTYNRASTIRRAVESVLRQTFEDFELIVVDDGSTDNTAKYLRSIADPRLKVVVLEKNRGLGAARNAGIAEARSPYLAFQDSDDEWLVTFLERQLAVLESASPEFGACYCGKIQYGRDDHLNFGKRRAAYMPDLARQVVEGDLYKEVLRHAIVSTQTLVVRTDLVRQIGGFDESLRIGLDWELSTRLTQITKYKFIDEPLVMTFLMPDSVSHRRLAGAFTLQRILDNNAAAFQQDARLHSERLVDMARTYQKAEQWKDARPFAAQALRRWPSARAVATWVFGMAAPVFGSVRKPRGPAPETNRRS